MKMIPKNTSKIILFLLKNINEVGYNINRISKLLGISVGSAFKILKDLEKDKIVTCQNISNSSQYRINLNNAETVKICELLLLQERKNLKDYAKLYAEDIMKFEYADLIMLFGSILRNKEFNDVDVLFVTKNIKKVNDFCLETSKVRTKPVVPLILQKEDLINEIRNKKDSVLEIIKTGIVLKGEDAFVEVIKNVNSQV